jgi:hypothetical protein
MTDSTAEFFHELDRRRHEPLLEKATGSVRFDLADGGRIDRWLVLLDRAKSPLRARISHTKTPTTHELRLYA